MGHPLLGEPIEQIQAVDCLPLFMDCEKQDFTHHMWDYKQQTNLYGLIELKILVG